MGRGGRFSTRVNDYPQERARRCRVKNQSRRTRSSYKRFPTPFPLPPRAGFLPSPGLFVLVRLDNEQPIRRRASPLSATVDFVPLPPPFAWKARHFQGRRISRGSWRNSRGYGFLSEESEKECRWTRLNPSSRLPPLPNRRPSDRSIVRRCFFIPTSALHVPLDRYVRENVMIFFT